MMRTKKRTSAARPLPSVPVGRIAAIAALVLAGCGTAASGQEQAAVGERAAPARLADVADQSSSDPEQGPRRTAAGYQTRDGGRRWWKGL